jgi:hypothetical protein
MSASQQSASPPARRLPQVVGGIGAALALVLYLALTLSFPQLADWAFAQRGKAPMLVGLLGIAFMAGGYCCGQRVTSRLVRRRG